MSGLEDDHGKLSDEVDFPADALLVDEHEVVVTTEVDDVVVEIPNDITDLFEDLINLVETSIDNGRNSFHRLSVEERLHPTSDVPDDVEQCLPQECEAEDVAPVQVQFQAEVSMIAVTANSSTNHKKSVFDTKKDTIGDIISYVVNASRAYNDSISKFGKAGARKKRCLSPSEDKSVKKLKVEWIGDETKKLKLKWAPGDIVWFKVRDQPYWPGTISFSSDVKEYVRLRGGISEFHVTPFGKDISGKWILAPQILKFQGRVQYEEHVSVMMSRVSEVCQKQQMGKFVIKDSWRKEWERVVCRVEKRCLKAQSNSPIEHAKSPKRRRRKKLKEVSKTDVSLPDKSSDDSSIVKKAKKKRKKLKTSLEVPLMSSLSSNTTSESLADSGPQEIRLLTSSSFLQKTDDSIKKKRRKRKLAPEIVDQIVTKEDESVAVKRKRKRKTLKHSKMTVSCQPESSDRNDIIDSGKNSVEDMVSAPKCGPETCVAEEKCSKQPKTYKTAGTPMKDFKKTVNGRMSCNNVSPAKDDTPKKHDNRASLSDSIHCSGDSDSAAEVKKDGPTDCKSDKVCQACEKIIAVTGDGIRCVGGCYGIFHKACANPPLEADIVDNYKCASCISGIHVCFVCKKSEGEMRRCIARMCGKHYHISCLSVFITAKTSGNAITCSLHSCLSCALAKQRKAKSKLVRCLRCPVAYHTSEECLAAGSLVLSSHSILCPRHYEPARNPRSRVVHVNVNWCFMCSTGGSLICCETCPASFHTECLHIEPPDECYYCMECLSGTQPKYGDVVWAKLGTYRWWPAKIFNPRNVPPNIRSIPHQPGEFPVCFFGTHDYYWTSRSRVFQFQEGDQGAHDNASNRLAKLYEKALNEASVAYHEWKSAKECRAALDFERNNLHPPRFRFIKTNRPVGKVTVSTVDPSQMTPCDCDPESESPCGSDSDCLNRMLMFECHPAVCPAGERCFNQRFEKRQYVPAEVFRAEGKGWGLRNLQDVKKGDFVNEYVGELIDEEECRRRMKKMHEENKTSYYFLTIDKDRIIDAAQKGNLSRFMNHSCQPNCETHKWTVNGDTRVGLFAVCDIPSGTELTFNYNLDCLGNEKTTCKCQAPNCSGFIGERPKNTHSAKKSNKGINARKKKRKSRAVKNEHEDECYRCGLGGELLMCDRRTCPKAYHLSCLKLNKPPHGRWECPWHHCDICGKAASLLCNLCPNSFCKDHMTNNIMYTSSGTASCREHSLDEVNMERKCTKKQDQNSLSLNLGKKTIPSSSRSASKELLAEACTTNSQQKTSANCKRPNSQMHNGTKQRRRQRPPKPSLKRIPNGRKMSGAKPRSRQRSSKSKRQTREVAQVIDMEPVPSSIKHEEKNLSKDSETGDTTNGDSPAEGQPLDNTSSIIEFIVNSVASSAASTAVTGSKDSLTSSKDSLTSSKDLIPSSRDSLIKTTTMLNGKLKHLRIKPLLIGKKKRSNVNVNGMLPKKRLNGRVFKRAVHCDCDVPKPVRRIKKTKPKDHLLSFSPIGEIGTSKTSNDELQSSIANDDSSARNCAL